MCIRREAMINAIKLINETNIEGEKRFVLCIVDNKEEMLFVKDYVNLTKKGNSIVCRFISSPLVSSQEVTDLVIKMLQFNGSSVVVALKGIEIPKEILNLCNE